MAVSALAVGASVTEILGGECAAVGQRSDRNEEPGDSLRVTVGHFQLTTAPTSSVRDRSVGAGNRAVSVRLLPAAHRPVATPIQKPTARSRAGAASALLPFRDDETAVLRTFCADDIAAHGSRAWRMARYPRA